MSGGFVFVASSFFRPRSLPFVSFSCRRPFAFPVPVVAGRPLLSWRCDVPLCLNGLRNDSVFAVVIAELLFDLFLDRHGNSREQCREPIELDEKLPTHLTDGERLSAASLHVDLLLVLQELLIPVEQIRRWLREANVHEAETADVRRICVLDQAVQLLACQLQCVQFVQQAELRKERKK